MVWPTIYIKCMVSNTFWKDYSSFTIYNKFSKFDNLYKQYLISTTTTKEKTPTASWLPVQLKVSPVEVPFSIQTTVAIMYSNEVPGPKV